MSSAARGHANENCVCSKAQQGLLLAKPLWVAFSSDSGDRFELMEKGALQRSC